MASKPQLVLMTMDLRDRFIERVRQLGIGRWYWVLVVPWYPKRTLSQNDWYRAFIVPGMQQLIRQEWGEEVDEDRAHRELAALFLTVAEEHTNRRTGEIVKRTRVRSTTELDTVQMSDYCENCRDFMAGYPYYILVPDPDPEKRSYRRASVKAERPDADCTQLNVEEFVKLA